MQKLDRVAFNVNNFKMKMLQVGFARESVFYTSFCWLRFFSQKQEYFSFLLVTV